MSDAPEIDPIVDNDETAAPTPDGHDSEGPEANEKKEGDELDQSLKLISLAIKEGEKSGVGVDSLASAAHFLRNTALLAPLRFAWEQLPAGIQRNFAMADQSGAGEFLMKYFPQIDLRAYFLPGTAMAALALLGVVGFKLTEEEEKQMHAELGENPSEAAKVAFQAQIEEAVVQKIVLPGEGIPALAGGALGMAAAEADPALAPAVAVAKVGDIATQARDSLLSQVRARVHSLDVQDAQAADVDQEVGKEHAGVAKDVQPEVKLDQ